MTTAAACPGGTLLTGGGFHLHTTTGAIPNNSLRATGTFAGAADGSPVGSGGAHSWGTIGGAGGVGMTDALTTSLAVCGPGPGARVVRASAAGPDVASSQVTVTALCPAGTLLMGGGVNTDLNGGTPQQGVHLTGSYPSTPAGAPVVSGESAGAWAVIVHAGGQPTPGTQSHAFAMCAP